MSPAELAEAPVGVSSRLAASWRLLRSELRLIFGRRRNLLLLAGLAVVPVIVGTVVAVTQDTAVGDQGPAFLDRITGNGLFLVMTSLMMCITFLLPLVISVGAGDTIAGEAQAGTLRYLLTVPVPRARLLAVKAIGAFTFTGAAVLVVAVSALVTGAAYFGVGDMTLLSGDTVSFGQALARTAAITAYVAISLSGLVAVGLFISTITEVPIAAMAATMVASVVSTVLDQLPQLRAIQPYLFTHYWLTFAEFLRFDVDWAALGQGAAVQVGWVALFGALAWARFTTADISS